jgi:hypothetical protein
MLIIYIIWKKKPIKKGKPANDSIVNENIILNNIFLFKKKPNDVILSKKIISLLSSFFSTKSCKNIKQININKV